jgi:hypothetical protein
MSGSFGRSAFGRAWGGLIRLGMVSGVMSGMVMADTAAGQGAGAQRVAGSPYVWRNVVIRGGGFVSGIVFSSKEKGLVYARTDVGGAYRSDDAGEHWRPLLDGFGRKDSSFQGIESLALDPQDANKVYLAAGMYSADWGGPAAILRSSNKGRNWQGTLMPFKMGGNDDGRNCGEKLAVDPNLGSVLLFGSRKAGLWKSADSGVTWNQVDSFPVKDKLTGAWDKVGVSFVLFDKASGKVGSATPGIYVGVGQAEASLYHSADGGATWQLVAGAPKDLFPSHAVGNGTGQFYFSFVDSVGPNGMTNGAILKYSASDGKWADVSPVKPGANGLGKFGFGGLGMDLEHPDTLMVTTLDRWWPTDAVFRTTDGGKHWKDVSAGAMFGAKAVPWVYWHKDSTGGTGWMTDIAIDPFNSAKVMYTTGEGIWGTADATAVDSGKPTHWGFPNEGLEETVAISLISPPEGAHLLSGVGDIGGFRHDDLGVSPANGFFFEPQLNNTDGLDFAQQKPLTIVRVGSGDSKLVRGAMSVDGGVKWTAFASEPPTSKRGSGRVAIAADASVIVWTPEKGDAQETADKGKSWTACAGLGPEARVVSDRVKATDFYSFDAKTGKLFASNDGAKTFVEKGTAGAGGTDHALLAAAPDAAGELWVVTGETLYRSVDGGATFGAVDGLDKAYTISFGMAAPGASHTALYAVATKGSADGIYRSDDTGKTWVRVNDGAHQYGYINLAVGDPRVYGRVYLGTGGRGIVYGEPYVSGKDSGAVAGTGSAP